MPVELPFSFRATEQDAFHADDRIVMRHAFAIQNEFGRLLDERIYQRELTYRCQADGLMAETEVPLHVSYATFRKIYYLDLLVSRGTIYELKTVSALAGVHETQLLNYLLLAGQQHGKLVNFRTPSVELRFVSTRLTTKRRKEVSFDHTNFHPATPRGLWFAETIRNIVADWGAFLDVDLYREAIVHLLGGKELVSQSVEIVHDNRSIGMQKVDLLEPDAAFLISSVTQRIQAYCQHLQRLVSHTRLKALYWVNLNHHHIAFRTLSA